MRIAHSLSVLLLAAALVLCATSTAHADWGWEMEPIALDATLTAENCNPPPSWQIGDHTIPIAKLTIWVDHVHDTGWFKFTFTCDGDGHDGDDIHSIRIGWDDDNSGGPNQGDNRLTFNMISLDDQHFYRAAFQENENVPAGTYTWFICVDFDPTMEGQHVTHADYHLDDVLIEFRFQGDYVTPEYAPDYTSTVPSLSVLPQPVAEEVEEGSLGVVIADFVIANDGATESVTSFDIEAVGVGDDILAMTAWIDEDDDGLPEPGVDTLIADITAGFTQLETLTIELDGGLPMDLPGGTTLRVVIAADFAPELLFNAAYGLSVIALDTTAPVVIGLPAVFSLLATQQLDPQVLVQLEAGEDMVQPGDVRAVIGAMIVDAIDVTTIIGAIELAAAGDGVAIPSVTAVELARDSNGNGQFDGADPLVASGVFNGPGSRVTFPIGNVALTHGSRTRLFVLYTLAGTAPTGTETGFTAVVMELTTPTIVNGLPAESDPVAIGEQPDEGDDDESPIVLPPALGAGNPGCSSGHSGGLPALLLLALAAMAITRRWN